MDNQHKKIKGYRDLSQEEINLMNDVKETAEKVRILCGRIDNILTDDAEADILGSSQYLESLTWLNSGKEDLQVGFMKVVRSIARPTTF